MCPGPCRGKLAPCPDICSTVTNRTCAAWCSPRSRDTTARFAAADPGLVPLRRARGLMDGGYRWDRPDDAHELCCPHRHRTARHTSGPAIKQRRRENGNERNYGRTSWLWTMGGSRAAVAPPRVARPAHRRRWIAPVGCRGSSDTRTPARTRRSADSARRLPGLQRGLVAPARRNLSPHGRLHHAGLPHVRHIHRRLRPVGGRDRGHRVPARRPLGVVGATGRQHHRVRFRDDLRQDCRGDRAVRVVGVPRPRRDLRESRRHRPGPDSCASQRSGGNRAKEGICREPHRGRSYRSRSRRWFVTV